MTQVVGVDLGGTKIAAGLVDPHGQVVARAELPTPAQSGPAAVLDAVLHLIETVAGSSSGVTSVGIGSAGTVDPVRGVIVAATDSLPGWAGTAVAERVGAQLQLPVTVVNDVHAHGIGEAWIGAARDTSRSLTVAVGTGIGGAWVVGGRVDPGARFAAGHVGHVPADEASGLPCSCGRSGHLEALSSGPGLYRQYLRRGGDPTASDARSVVARAHDGEPVAIEVVTIAARALGRALGGLINVFDPEAVVVAGGLTSAGELWWSAVREGVAHDVMDVVAECPVLPGILGGDAAIIGAARAAILRQEGAPA